MENKISASPLPKLSMIDAISIIIGIVIGAGIFRTPSIVASNSGNAYFFLTSWLLGGIVSLIGALCYAELTTTYPNTGGDYHFLKRSFGHRLAFLFAWARMSIIQTGSIALLSFIAADYLSEIYPLGSYSSTIYATLVVVTLTIINAIGIQFGTSTQKALTLLEVLGIVIIILSGLFYESTVSHEVSTPAVEEKETSLGLALVFVLLTYGGWNEAAYISAELRTGARKMATILVWSIAIITLAYMLANYAYLKVLGLNGVSSADAVGAALMQTVYGKTGGVIISLLIIISSLTSANATIFTGARTNYALGKDYVPFRFLGKWNKKTSSPVNALILQCLIALALIALGAYTRTGFETIVDYTAPVFWLFFLLTGISLFILRKKDPGMKRPFRVPAYPILPGIFCLSSAYLLYSSLVYTGLGALVGVAILFIGIFLLLILKQKKT